MVRESGHNYEEKKPVWTRKWFLAGGIFIICVLISWIMIAGLAAPKADSYKLAAINSTVTHMNDTLTGLSNYLNKQSSTITQLTDNTQSALDDFDFKIGNLKSANDSLKSDVASVKSDVATVKGSVAQQNTTISQIKQKADTIDSINSTVNGMSTTVNNLNSTVSNLSATVSGLSSSSSGGSGSGSIQVTSTLSTGSGSGTITLAITSAVAQTVSFEIEFRPATEMTEYTANNNIDEVYKLLGGSPPVYLTAGSSVAPEFSLNYSSTDSMYHLRRITFLTLGTPIVIGSNTKTITFTYTGIYSYDILITPISMTSTTSTGATLTTW